MQGKIKMNSGLSYPGFQRIFFSYVVKRRHHANIIAYLKKVTLII